MTRLNITAKIWLSIGVFVLGFVLATALGQIAGLETESGLANAADALFPAAQQSQAGEAAFQRMEKGFSDAVITQDSGGIERAAEEGARVSAGLRAVAAAVKSSPERAREAATLADEIDRLSSEAKSVYSGALTQSGGLSQTLQEKMMSMAQRTQAARTALANIKERCSQDLRAQLTVLRTKSVRQRWLTLGLFVATLVISGFIVNLTIRRSITQPISRVIERLRESADQAAQSSEEMATSGAQVAQDAEHQAASIEETSASLEEISATTRRNVTRTHSANDLMSKARETVNAAAQAMENLTESMQAVSRSSNQVASVLKTIDEIAFNTNILALNAAVEAARAGESGAGFSVVAAEVRALAQRAAESARNSAEIVQRTISDVGRGVQYVGVAQNAFQNVSAAISDSAAIVGEIATGSEDQAHRVTLIGQAMTRIEAVTQNNSANARRTAEAAEGMGTQVRSTREHLEELLQVVGQRS